MKLLLITITKTFNKGIKNVLPSTKDSNISLDLILLNKIFLMYNTKK